jgi:ArsR family transcriptional regulator
MIGGKMKYTQENYDKLSDFFKALADSTRVKILFCLYKGEKAVSEIANETETSQSAVSHQLRLLKDKRIVKQRREGRYIFYSIDDDHVEKLLMLGLDHIIHE